MPKFDDNPAKIAALRSRLLEWYERNRRNLPWRQAPILTRSGSLRSCFSNARGRSGRTLSVVYEALSHAGFAGPGRRAEGAGTMERPGLLSARRACCTRRRSLWPRIWEATCRSARSNCGIARHRGLHGGGDCEHCSRGAGSGCGRQRGTRAVPRGPDGTPEAAKAAALRYGPRSRIWPGGYWIRHGRATSTRRSWNWEPRFAPTQSAMPGLPACRGLQDTRRAQNCRGGRRC